MMCVNQWQLNNIGLNLGFSPINNCPGPLTMDDLKKIYQTPDDELVVWSATGGYIDGYDITITKKESELLNELSLNEIVKMNSIKNKSFSKADEIFDPEMKKPDHISEDNYENWKRNDGHNDAFRHAYWNALMTKKLGHDFAYKFATAHEGLPGNIQSRETMDLYNNSVGRQIALDNPDVSDEKLADLVFQKIESGKLIVVNKDGVLDWSDKVLYGDHGYLTDDE